MSNRPLLDLVLECTSAIGIEDRIFEDLDTPIQPNLIRHVAVFGTPVSDDGDVSREDALTVFHTIEELAQAGFFFDPDMSWRFYDLQNTENKLQRPEFQSGPVYVHKNFIQEEPRPADLVIAPGFKPPEFTSMEAYQALEAADAFARGVDPQEVFQQIVDTIAKSDASIVAARDSGVSSRRLIGENTPAIFVRPSIPNDKSLPRDYSLDLSIKPEVIGDYLAYEEGAQQEILNRRSLLMGRILAKYEAQDWSPQI